MGISTHKRRAYLFACLYSHEIIRQRRSNYKTDILLARIDSSDHRMLHVDSRSTEGMVLS